MKNILGLNNETDPRNRGGSTDYYKLPKDAIDLQDLIEHKGMNFARGDMFKAIYRLGEKDGTPPQYDLNKIIWYANRELRRIKRESHGRARTQ